MTSIAAVIETKIDDDVTREVLALATVVCNGGNSVWINDYGAINHMSCDSRHVSAFAPASQKSISTANGNSASVIGKDSCPALIF